jgi:hypothetical protein
MLPMVIVATALAIQPDRAMAGMMMVSLAVLLMMRPNRHVAAALVASVAAFTATVIRPDTLPLSPYVDQILYTSFDVHVVAGLAVWLGSALLVVPAIVGWWFAGAHAQAHEDKRVYLVFGLAWLSAIIAAALGNYPTPVVGYSGGAILGYVMSLAALPATPFTQLQVKASINTDTTDRAGRDGTLYAG